ncbi:hypothetical protein L1887_00266 [Cichorium endivia]|nr:hypothetical protein L1887_00266 [Cichorium endivia]
MEPSKWLFAGLKVEDCSAVGMMRLGPVIPKSKSHGRSRYYYSEIYRLLSYLCCSNPNLIPSPISIDS